MPWIVKMNSDILKDNVSANQIQTREFLKHRGIMILDGVKLAVEIKRHVKNLLLMHQTTGVQLN